MIYFSTNSIRGNTPVTKRMTPNKAAENKKIAVSSFIQVEEKLGEELLPDRANWDASAIEAPIESNTDAKENVPGKA